MSNTEPVDVNIYIDDRNKNLYTALSKDFNISLNRFLQSRPDGNNSLWLCIVNQNEVNISYYEDIKSTGFFTHELFHIDLIQNGFTNFMDLFPLIQETSKKELIFSRIIGHINNILGHAKFYDKFISLGYAAHEFTNDYHSPVDVVSFQNQINDGFENSSLPNDSVCHFITCFFSAKDNRNPERKNDYDNLLLFLQEKDRILYEILENTWSYWTTNDTLDNKTLLQKLFEDVEIWHKNR